MEIVTFVDSFKSSAIVIALLAGFGYIVAEPTGTFTSAVPDTSSGVITRITLLPSSELINTFPSSSVAMPTGLPQNTRLTVSVINPEQKSATKSTVVSCAEDR